jgi:phosphotransferase system HPr (HPr) family protein
MTTPSSATLRRTLTVTNKVGLHARSAAKIIQLIQKYQCQVHLAKDGRMVEGDSILSLLTLNCPRGSMVEVRAEGPEAQLCLDDLSRLFARKFDED